MRNVSDERFKENQNTHFVFSDVPPPPPLPKTMPVYEIMWKDMVEPDRPQMRI